MKKMAIEAHLIIYGHNAMDLVFAFVMQFILLYQLLFFFRYKNVFARLIIHGFNNSQDPRLGVEFAGRYSKASHSCLTCNTLSKSDFWLYFDTESHSFLCPISTSMMQKIIINT